LGHAQLTQSPSVAAPTAPVAPTVLVTPAPVPLPRTPDQAATPTPVSRNPTRHAECLYRIKEGDIGLLFLGDSITDFWPRRGEYSWLKFAPYNPADFGISGERTDDVLWRITNGELDGIHPKVVVLMIGTNNATAGDQSEWTAAGIEKIVATIRVKLPESKILLLGIFPRDPKANARRTINANVNAIISKLDNGSSIRYLDIGNVFLDTNGDIPPDIMPDKLHPAAAGYDRWYAAMLPLLTEMMK
jgi:beta-glucosidase